MRSITTPLPAIPRIKGDENFDDLVRALSVFFVEAIDTSLEWDELRKDVYPQVLKPLVRYLVGEVQHEEIVCALLALKWHFGVLEDGDDRGVNETRGLACEMVAWRFVTHLTRKETIDCLCHELPADNKSESRPHSADDVEAANLDGVMEDATIEQAPLLGGRMPELDDSFYDEYPRQSDYAKDAHFSTVFATLNALEIAAVAEAKRFLSQKSIQHIINGIWKGDVVFWTSLQKHSTKRAKIYRKNHSDPFCRLRVPLYSKLFEVLFFAAFLAFYYAVLVQRPVQHISTPEIMLYVWLVSFAYNELVEFLDAGSTFYAADFWSLWDLGIIFVGMAFFILRMIGLAKNDHYATDIAFDILSIEALFLVPRICSLLSLHPYFGMLLPVLKEMTKDFAKFAVLVVIAYAGFSSAFSVLGRDHYTLGRMNWILIKVFFGSSYLGFISPILGPPLMFLFVAMTNILLITSLTSLLSNKLDKVMDHARDEYLFVYAVYVLEASTSNRLTYFLPPLNLIPLLLRPLRLVLPNQQLRTLRISLLKATHFPLVGLILAYENGRLWIHDRRTTTPGDKIGVSKRLSRHPIGRKALSSARVHLLDEQAQAPDRSAEANSPEEDLSAAANASDETIEALTTAVADLKSQIESLSELLKKKSAMVSQKS
ncbi:unnamed protein product [Zymoseptoria tritici ST99CH_1A5]|uniref:Calcium channel YVC1-like C-terminal transmembrane domain-containing protein n=1 Tax=Zymoseptoria tritici ST99CH_1A5 TaxID=1276529 RepID=A0A1Y6LU72_ZYMTR|nr:unnamed protein product [Zymoseptoria tritici ST99CH_1A5]